MEHDPPFNIEDVWRRLCKWALFLIAWLGDPAALARLVIGADAYEHIAAQLKALEAGVRRALLIQALVMRKPPAPPPRVQSVAAAPRVKRARKPAISFRLVGRVSRPGAPKRIAPFRERPALLSAAPLARRYEAVLRVIDNRDRYAFRLAALINGTYIKRSSWRAPTHAARTMLTGLDRVIDPILRHHNLRVVDMCFAAKGGADDG